MIQSNPPLHLSYLLGRSEALSELAALLEQSESTLFRSLDVLRRQLEARGRGDVLPVIERITRERQDLLDRILDVRDETLVESQLASALAVGAGQPS